MAEATGEALARRIWEVIRPMVRKEIDDRTRNCCRMKKMTVTTAYNGTTKKVGVKEAFDNETFLPVIGDMNTGLLTKGATVWVLELYGDLSNALVVMRGDGAR